MSWENKSFCILLKRWQKQIKFYTLAHKREALSLRKKHYILGGLATVLGTVVTAVGIAFSQDPIQWVAIVQDIFTGIVTGLAGLVTFLSYQKRSEKHHETANRYQALDRLISTILALPPTNRDDPTEVLATVRTQFDDIVSSSPIPTSITKLSETLEYKVQTDHEDEEKTNEDVAIPIGIEEYDIGGNMRLTQRLETERKGVINGDISTQMLLYQIERMNNREDIIP